MPLPQPEPESARKRRSLREQALAARAAMSDEQRAAATAAIEIGLAPLLQRLAARTLGFCWPFRGEPDLRAFVTGWLAADAQRRAALPAVLDKAAPMVFRAWRPGVPMSADRHGIPIPAAGPSLVPDVVLVPLNAFDAAGFRLGYGGGYFDRTLAMIDSTAVGVGFESGRVGTTLPQTHDRPMAWIVTEEGVFEPMC
ncbi:MAG TPA: 5-formyltetrahydrofolate cyclo-ligase [Rhodocyclaceae bacterium]|nr:5-formyltetrahydrofolate cyclo-ligase [Rhodocyclaceae bacterium]